jgi:hypothetical protein
MSDSKSDAPAGSGGGGGGGGKSAAVLTPSLLRPLRDVAALEPAVEGGRGFLLLHLRSQEREERLELERWDGAERVVAAFFDGEP